MTGAYEYTRGRRPLRAAAELLVAAGLLYLAARFEAPWWIWSIWGIACLGIFWDVFLAPSAGCRIDERQWSWHVGRSTTNVALDQIDRVAVTGWSDGPDTYTVHLKDGAEISPHSGTVPSGRTLGDELARRGVRVER